MNFREFVICSNYQSAVSVDVDKIVMISEGFDGNLHLFFAHDKLSTIPVEYSGEVEDFMKENGMLLSHFIEIDGLGGSKFFIRYERISGIFNQPFSSNAKIIIQNHEVMTESTKDEIKDMIVNKEEFRKTFL